MASARVVNKNIGFRWLKISSSGFTLDDLQAIAGQCPSGENSDSGDFFNLPFDEETDTKNPTDGLPGGDNPGGGSGGPSDLLDSVVGDFNNDYGVDFFT